MGNIRSLGVLRPIARERKYLMDYNYGYLPSFVGIFFSLFVTLPFYNRPIVWNCTTCFGKFLFKFRNIINERGTLKRFLSLRGFYLDIYVRISLEIVKYLILKQKISLL